LSEVSGLRISWASTALISPRAARWRARAVSRSIDSTRWLDRHTHSARKQTASAVTEPTARVAREVRVSSAQVRGSNSTTTQT
jgi:hypothetical protein